MNDELFGDVYGTVFYVADGGSFDKVLSGKSEHAFDEFLGLDHDVPAAPIDDVSVSGFCMEAICLPDGGTNGSFEKCLSHQQEG
jgi:hypothetical protein